MKGKIISLCLTVVLLAVMVLPLPASAQTTITDLGTLGGVRSWAYGINGLGQVVGYSYNASGYPRAFLWTAAGGMVDLGTLPGGSVSSAQGINDLGQVVGSSSTASGGRAFVWTAVEGMVDMGTLPGGSYSLAQGINDLGQVVGFSSMTLGFRAFVWTAAGGMVDLGTLPGGDISVALGINDLGQVVGYSSTASGYQHAALWTQGAASPVTIESISTGVDALVGSGLQPGQGNALKAKLAAAGQLEKGNTGAVANVLQAFINQVSAFISGGVLTAAQGQPLIDAAIQFISEQGG